MPFFRRDFAGFSGCKISKTGFCAAISLIFTLISSPHIGAQTQKEFVFHRLSIEHGLSQNSVTSIVQDKKGFIWFGTQDGLNRYDGYNFTIYRHDPDQSATLSNNYIHCISQDGDGFFWIGTDGGGLNRFDPGLNRFISYQHTKADAEGPISNYIFMNLPMMESIEEVILM